MPLISVTRDKYARSYGHPKFRAAHATAYEQVELVEALTRSYTSDAHLVSYVLPPYHPLLVDGDKQPRLSKQHTAPSILADAITTTIVLDVDNPGHAKWTDEGAAAAIASYARLPLPCGVYHTTGGARFVLPLEEPVPSSMAEALIRRAMRIFDDAGFAVDHSAKDWTRHMRLPNVVRDNRVFHSPYLELSRMRPVTLEPLDIPTRSEARRRRAPLPPIPFTPTLAEHWQNRARVIGQAIASSVVDEFHKLYLAIGGALLEKQVPPEHVPELIRLIATAAASAKPTHHERSARDTVAKYLSGESITGLAKLKGSARLVADAVHAALDDAVYLSQPKPEAAPRPDIADVTAALERAIGTAPDGLTVIAAECGLGKTRAAQAVAAIRATSRPTTAKRAPLQTKTAISVDKNELAMQVAGDIVAQGVSVRRVFGPLSVVDAEGRPVCRLHDRALPLVAGGQSVRDVLCLGRGRYRCPHYDDCTAKDGFVDLHPTNATETDASPRVIVGTHSLLRELDASAGSTGLLVVDEPRTYLESLTVAIEDLNLALTNLRSFQEDFAEAMEPVLLAAKDWFASPELSFADISDTLEAPPTEDAKGRRLHAPPLRLDVVGSCRHNPILAATLGKVSGVLRALHRAMTNPRALARLEGEPARIVITAPDEALELSLRREGAVVAMDANADLHLPAFAKVVGYDPPVHRFAAGDGAPIDRLVLQCGSGNRKNWLAHGRLVLDTGLLSALRGVVTWAEECAQTLGRPVQLGIITIGHVELALRAAFATTPRERADVEAAWVKARQTAKTLNEAATSIADIFATAAIVRPVQLAHFGATRGLNRMAGVDCLATVGDPWANLGDVQTEADYLDVDANDRMDAKARAELEQAHGRLRTVHRRVPGFALHVGHVRPGGTGWAFARTTTLPNGRPAAGRPMPRTELETLVEALGGVRSAARAVLCSHTTIRRYLAGAGVPPGVASKLRELGSGT